MTTKRNTRLLALLGGVFCIGVLGSAYVLEYGFDMEPCSLCLLQRWVFYSMMFVFFLSALHNPKRCGGLVYCAFLFLLSTTGIALALRHLWVQYWAPANMAFSCTAGLQQLLASKPFLSAIQEVLSNSHDCSQIDTLFGLPLSMLSLMSFLLLMGWVVYLSVMQIKRRT